MITIRNDLTVYDGADKRIGRLLESAVEIVPEGKCISYKILLIPSDPPEVPYKWKANPPPPTTPPARAIKL